MINLDLMRKRLEWQGGIHQEDRMIKDKQRTFHRALLYSYQACSVELVQKHNTVLYEEPQLDEDMMVFGEVRALINPDKLKQDYDDKIISVDYDHCYEPGDVFEWKRTDTHWLIYTRQITEDAYFRGEIRRCRHTLKFKDPQGNICRTWVAIRGPVETAIVSEQKNQERVHSPNLTLEILMPGNDITISAFDRYKEFIFESKLWKVTATDSISMQGVLQLTAIEDYYNEETDDMVNEIADGLVVEPQDPTPNSEIQGETFILPKMEEHYVAPEEGGEWCIMEKNMPVTLKTINNLEVTIKWNKAVSGQFTLKWTKGNQHIEKVIVVESLY